MPLDFRDTKAKESTFSQRFRSYLKMSGPLLIKPYNQTSTLVSAVLAYLQENHNTKCIILGWFHSPSWIRQWMVAAGGAVSYVSNVTAQFSSLKTDPRPLAPWPHSAHPPHLKLMLLFSSSKLLLHHHRHRRTFLWIVPFTVSFKNCLNLICLCK